MRRVVTPELLDNDAAPPEEIAGTLRDLRRVNRWFGGVSTTAALVERIAQRARCRELTMLDVGAGAGDLAHDLAAAFRNRGLRLDVTLLDRSASHLPQNGMRRVAGDALALPFRDSAFDVVACALLVHHLEPDEVVRFVNEALRISRRAVVINDLRRHPLHLALVSTGLRLIGNRVTVHDGIASVRRAYTSAELAEILRRTSAAEVEITPHYLFRMGAIAWKEAGS